MVLFYAPDIESATALPATESNHAVRVLRRIKGDEITVTDGKGYFYQCLIINPDPKSCELEIVNRNKPEKPWPCKIHIAVAPTKNMERMEWLAEKLAEMGIDSITCIRCRYSERSEIKTDRLTKILISAIKQSQKALLPVLNGMTDFEKFVAQQDGNQKFIAHCEADSETQLLHNVCLANRDVTVLIGPEGDFSKQEIMLALQNKFTPVSLGKSRLRTETAAFAACHTVHLINSMRAKCT